MSYYRKIEINLDGATGHLINEFGERLIRDDVLPRLLLADEIFLECHFWNVKNLGGKNVLTKQAFPNGTIFRIIGDIDNNIETGLMFGSDYRIELSDLENGVIGFVVNTNSVRFMNALGNQRTKRGEFVIFSYAVGTGNFIVFGKDYFLAENRPCENGELDDTPISEIYTKSEVQFLLTHKSNLNHEHIEYLLKTELPEFPELPPLPTLPNYTIGSLNTVGKVLLAVESFNLTTRIFTMFETNPLLTVGKTVQIINGTLDDNSPYNATISKVDKLNITLDLSVADIANIEKSPSQKIMLQLDDGITIDKTTETVFTLGNYHYNSGIDSFVAGSTNINSGDYSLVSGICNFNSGMNAVVSGSNNTNTAEHADIGGTSNSHLAKLGYGRYAFVRGSGNYTLNDNIICLGSGNKIHEMGAIVLGNLNGSEETSLIGRESVILGNRNETGDYAHAIGYNLKAKGKNSTLIGVYGTLESSDSFAVAGGTKDEPTLALTVTTRKGGSDEAFADDMAFSITYRGRLKATPKIFSLSGVQTANLDHDLYGQFILRGNGTANLQLSNWEDGDEALLIFNSAQIALQIPADWVTLGADFSEPRIYAVQIAKFEGTVFYSIKYPNATGGGTSSIGDTLSIGSNGNWYIGNNDTGVKAQGEKGEQGVQGKQGIQGQKGDKGETGDRGLQGNQGAQGAKGDRGDKGDSGTVQVVVSSTAPTNPVDGMIWIKP